MGMSRTVLQIVAEYLQAHGYNGLYSPDDCACVLEALAHCGEMRTDCMAGMRIPCDCGGGCAWHVGPKGEEGVCRGE